jgi:leader peptidase (prepilin peptidase) / N-methyltransferase
MTALVGAGIGGLLGAVIGSFLATILLRWPQGRSVLTGRSRCDHCGAKLSPRSLIPLLSFVVQQGRCARCDKPIDPSHLVIEAAAALIGGISGLLFAEEPAIAMVSASLGWMLLLIGALDLVHRWLPDRLTMMLALLGFSFAAVQGGAALGQAAIALVAGYGSLEIVRQIYRRWRGREGLGGGDPKLFGALGVWLGWSVLPHLLLAAALVGICVVAWLTLRGQPIENTLKLPLGTYLCFAAWPIWLFIQLA